MLSTENPAPVFFNGAFPIGGETNLLALPVKEIGPAIGYYVHVLGFTVSERSAKTALLRRDDATIGLEQNSADPEQVSVYFSVSDVDALQKEMFAKQIEPTSVMPSENDGKKYRVFFAKEPYGVCFCFGQAA